MLCKLKYFNESKFISRIAKINILLPNNINIRYINNILYFDNNIYFYELKIKKIILIIVKDKYISININKKYIKNKKELKFCKSYSGTIKSLISNIIFGLNFGFYKKIIIYGIGYKLNVENNILIFNLGYSHLIKCKVPINILIKDYNNNEIILFSYDKEALGNFCNEIKMLRKPDVYKGKGIRYDNDIIKIKNFRKK
ncbi:50S ribosomal protein L6 [Candidatus Nardonella dryophthoridicola]|uniref:50S ribosomal protein L6 n=1 Tax=Candidatus Nardonella dryophthoridicola TaxID=1971485 RepID=UPI001AD8737C|nr:50S ribosomal protein L6 [Candidatus Nardonella dryophthoridicola]QTJ62860.1 50S ribosomal protein L6 [Candidatus Nardonella dryophthoridicola]